LRQKFKDSRSNARAAASRVKYRKAKGLFVRRYKTSIRIGMIIAQKINDQTICQYSRKKNDNCHAEGIVFQHIACTTISVLKTKQGKVSQYSTVHPAYNPYFSACFFFSRNSVFLSQKISQQCFSAGLSAQPNSVPWFHT
jgi:hypothetical protein